MSVSGGVRFSFSMTQVGSPSIIRTGKSRSSEQIRTTKRKSPAGQIYHTGRFHVDPVFGPEIGNRPYRAWASNAFHHPKQNLLKCRLHGTIVAFMVVEKSGRASRGTCVQGVGRRVSRAVLNSRRQEGVDEVPTSISSQNIPVHNLSVSLGFRFSLPSITLHWCPFGRVVSPIP